MRYATPTLLMLLPFLGACVKAPVRTDADLGVTPPDEWTSDAPTGPVNSDWWESFDDAALDELVELALIENRDLQAAAARLDQAAADARIVSSELKPMVDLSASGNRQRQVFTGLPLPGGSLSTTSSRVGVSVDVLWEADLWGRIRAKSRAALADLQATDADLRGARLSIAGQTAKVWFGVAEALEQVELSRQSAKSFHDSAEWIRSRYAVGVRPAVDLRLALSNWEAAEASLEARRRQLDFTTRQLEVLVGQYPAGSILERYPVKALPDTPPPVPSGLPSELLARRPDLVAAERRLAASDQRIVSAKKSLYPRLTLTASGGAASNELTDLVEGDFGVWSLVAGLAQPLYQGGRLRAGVRLAEAISDEALARYAGAVLDAYAEVEHSLAAESYLAEQERHLTEASRQLTAAERLAAERYAAGVGDYLTVLDSQTRSFVARSNLITLRRIRLENRIDLFLALGGGFDEPGESDGAPPIEEVVASGGGR